MAQGDQLLQIIDNTLRDAAARAGEHLRCGPGCTMCCHGVFAISAADTARLRAGLRELMGTEPERADALRRRVEASCARLAAGFPGDAATGQLADFDDPAQEALAEQFEDFGNDEPCPVLDPATGRCDLYTARPVMCRTFGPPMPAEEGLGHCELCFTTAIPEEVLAAAVAPVAVEAWEQLDAGFDRDHGAFPTTVAFALRHH